MFLKNIKKHNPEYLDIICNFYDEDLDSLLASLLDIALNYTFVDENLKTKKDIIKHGENNDSILNFSTDLILFKKELSRYLEPEIFRDFY